jgi:hypothetical protein
MGSLSNLYISQSYQSLIHLETNNTASATLIGLQDGLGNSIGVSVNTGGNLYLSGSLTASLQEGYLLIGGANGKTYSFPTSSLVSNVNTSSLVTTASFNAYTQSNDSKVNSLINATASYAISSSVAAVDAAQQSQINSLIAASGSYLTSSIPLTSLNEFTASQNTKNTTLESVTSSLNQFTSSANNRLNNLESTSASVNISIANINSTTASQAISISNLNTFSQSAETSINNLTAATASYANSASVAVVDAAQQSQINSLIAASGSYLTSSVPLTSLNEFTASQLDINTGYNTFTSSANQRLTSIESVSGSWITESETASFARTNVDNNFTANQTFTNITAVSASFTYVQTTFETSSVIYSSGSNIFGDELTDIQTLSGSVKVQGSLTVNGTPVLTSSVDISGLVTTASFNAYTESNDSKVNSLINATASYANSASVALVDAGQQLQIDNLIAATGSYLTSSVPLTSLNEYTQSNDAKWNTLGGQTGSYVTSAITASSLVTASVNLNTITFTKGDATTFNITVDTGSAATINTGSFATTGSNIFVADQIITASAGFYYSNGTPTKLRLGSSENGQNFDFRITGSGVSQQQLWLIENQGGVWGNAFFGRMYVDSNLNVNQTFTASLQQGYVWVGNASNKTTLIPTSSFTGAGALPSGLLSSSVTNFVDYSASVDSRINAITSSGGTISVQDEGSILGNATSFNFNGAGVTATLSAGTASITIPGGGSTDTGSLMRTGSVSGNVLTFTKGDATTFSLTVATGSGASINTGSFATTGSNNFVGVQTINSIPGTGVGEVYLLGRSGSLVLGASTFTPTYAALVHLSSSAATNINLIFKTNTNTADTIISGSGNIFFNPAAPVTGFKRYLGLGNIALNGSNIPLISSSMAFSPTMNNNYFGAAGTTLTMRGPVSSSAWNINGNSVLGTINIGSSAALNAEKLTAGLNMINNGIQGTVTIIANQSALTGSTTTLTNNNINGTVTLNLSSSALTFTGNTINDTGFILTNQFSSSSVGLGLPTANANTIAGANNTFLMTGSQLTSSLNFGMSFNQNFVFGNGNTLFSNASNARVSGSNNYTATVATGLLGQRLIVSASSNTNDARSFGSVFVGRNNADDGIRNKTSDIVFAVGTGVSSSADTRKTGFLIDSGSNSYFEGTVNVSGSLTVQSGSTFFANGNRQFNVGAFQSNINQSGSANVSQSMNFEQTDISQGVSIASNSRITLANSGTYNIQFSAQILADTGADDVYIWLKKNGTNVSASAGHVVLANNEELIAAWNYVVDAVASDYFELAWQNTNGDAILLAENATGNIPSIPSIILTVTQVR